MMNRRGMLVKTATAAAMLSLLTMFTAIAKPVVAQDANCPYIKVDSLACEDDATKYKRTSYWRSVTDQPPVTLAVRQGE